MILTEYDEQAHIKSEKEISYEEGKAEERIEDVSKVLSDREYHKQLMQKYTVL